jgi:hypothetical protein
MLSIVRIPARWPWPEYSPVPAGPPPLPAPPGAPPSPPTLWTDRATHYLGVLALGDDENGRKTTQLARDARTFIDRFRRYEHMICRV